MSEHKDFNGDTLTTFKLKPCPFCNCPVKMEKGTTMRGPVYGVVCRSSEGYGGTCAIEQVPSVSIMAAAKRWNLRRSSKEPAREIVAYQFRMKTSRPGSEWTAWNICDEETFKQIRAADGEPSKHGIYREARRLYTDDQ